MRALEGLQWAFVFGSALLLCCMLPLHIKAELEFSFRWPHGDINNTHMWSSFHDET